MKIKALLVESFRSGTIASVAIVPLSPLFKAAGLRIGHYGPKFAGLYVSDPQPWLLFVQHLVIGWISALPLLLVFLATQAGRWPVMTGAAYGGGLLCGDQLAGIADLFQRPASLATWSLHRAAQPDRPCDLRCGDRPDIPAFCDPHKPATGCDVRQVDLTGRP